MSDVEAQDAAEAGRRRELLAAQSKALGLFAAIEAGGLVAPGRSEADVEADIYALAQRDFSVVQHWHRRIVRSGPHTLTTAADYPDARVIGPDDTVYIDLGPVFEDWEADIGRTYALGADPARRKLVADLSRAFDAVQRHYRLHPRAGRLDLGNRPRHDRLPLPRAAGSP